MPPRAPSITMDSPRSAARHPARAIFRSEGTCASEERESARSAFLPLRGGSGRPTTARAEELVRRRRSLEYAGAARYQKLAARPEGQRERTHHANYDASLANPFPQL